MERKEENVISVSMPRIEHTCKKCLYGNIVNPNRTHCAKFAKKPNEIYYEGKDCPYFKALKGDK